MTAEFSAMGVNGQSKRVSRERALALLRDGDLTELQNTLPWSSNYSFLMLVRDDDLEAQAVYKPQRGERPLWDFPDGTLCLREVAAYIVSEALGWNFVPPTILRDGHYGQGMLQLRVHADPNANYFTLGEAFRDQLERIALYDHVVNNADRKGGHLLLDEHDHLWSIDHGICFHTTPKIRTVIWDFAGRPIPANLLGDLQSLCEKMKGAGEGTLRADLDPLLSPREIAALDQRVESLLGTSTYPLPGPGRNYPWPPV